MFGYIIGTITGGDGDSQDDWADFDKSDDIAFSFDNGTDLETGLGGIGANGWTPVGLAGYAFLEVPVIHLMVLIMMGMALMALDWNFLKKYLPAEATALEIRLLLSIIRLMNAALYPCHPMD